MARHCSSVTVVVVAVVVGIGAVGSTVAVPSSADTDGTGDAACADDTEGSGGAEGAVDAIVVSFVVVSVVSAVTAMTAISGFSVVSAVPTPTAVLISCPWFSVDASAIAMGKIGLVLGKGFMASQQFKNTRLTSAPAAILDAGAERDAGSVKAAWRVDDSDKGFSFAYVWLRSSVGDPIPTAGVRLITTQMVASTIELCTYMS